MTHQKSPNRWSCLPTSLAMCLDVPVAGLIEKLGHDGSEILWPELPEPVRRRGFHVEELAYVCRQYNVVLACYVPRFGYNPLDTLDVSRDRVYDFDREYKELLSLYNGVVVGCYRRSQNAHAVAWNAAEDRIYDPDGVFAERDSFNAECFYAVLRTL